MALNLQIPFTAPATTLAGFNALASGMGEFLKQQQEKQKEIADLQSQKNKADIILKHFAGSNRPDGTPYITPQELLDYQNAPLKKQVDIAQGLAANVAFDTAQRNQALQQYTTGLQNTGRTLQNGIAALNYQKALNPLPPIQAQPVTTPDGKTVATAITGGGLKGPHIIQGPQGEQLQLTDAELANYKATGKIPLRTSARSFQAADDPSSPLNQLKGPKDKPDTWSQLLEDASKAKQLIDDGTLTRDSYDKIGQVFSDRIKGLSSRSNAAVTEPNVAVQVKTVEEAMALPPGTKFVTPDGRVKIR